MSKYGIVYIVHRDTDPEDVFKVGQSTRTVEERIADLNSETTSFGIFKPVSYFVVSDIDGAERDSHVALKGYILKNNREFFRLERDRCVEIVGNATLKYRAGNMIPEVNSRKFVESELERKYRLLMEEKKREEEKEREEVELEKKKEEKEKEEERMRRIIEEHEEKKEKENEIKREYTTQEKHELTRKRRRNKWKKLSQEEVAESLKENEENVRKLFEEVRKGRDLK
jgi:hypothetical protein